MQPARRSAPEWPRSTAPQPDGIGRESILRREENRSTRRKTLWVRLASTETQPTYNPKPELNLGHGGGRRSWWPLNHPDFHRHKREKTFGDPQPDLALGYVNIFLGSFWLNRNGGLFSETSIWAVNTLDHKNLNWRFFGAIIPTIYSKLVFSEELSERCSRVYTKKRFYVVWRVNPSCNTVISYSDNCLRTMV